MYFETLIYVFRSWNEALHAFTHRKTHKMHSICHTTTMHQKMGFTHLNMLETVSHMLSHAKTWPYTPSHTKTMSHAPLCAKMTIHFLLCIEIVNTSMFMHQGMSNMHQKTSLICLYMLSHANGLLMTIKRY